MFTTIIFVLAVVTSSHAGRPGRYQSRCYARPNSTILDYTVTDIYNRNTTKVSDLARGALTLVVNVATYCRLTLHYLQLNQLLEENQNLNVLAFPCDQFGHQEPGVNGTEILNGLRYVRPGNGFEPHPRIHLLRRGDVNGQKEAPLYTYLKSSCPPPTLAKFKSRESFWDPIKPSDVSWNFEKFLVSASGVPLYRFLPNVEPSRFQPIIRALSEPNQEPASQTEKLKGLLNGLDDSIEHDQSA